MINKVHERALRLILGGDLSDSESLLQINKEYAVILKISKAL